MKNKNVKQHISSLKNAVCFEVFASDKWGNQTLIASLHGKELSRALNLSCESEIKNAKDKILNQIKNYI